MNTQNKNSPTDKKKTPKRYAFAQKEGDEFSCVNGRVAFAPESEELPDGRLPMKFDYTIKVNPTDIALYDNKDFINYIGDILLELLEEQLKTGEIINAR